MSDQRIYFKKDYGVTSMDLLVYNKICEIYNEKGLPVSVKDVTKTTNEDRLEIRRGINNLHKKKLLDLVSSRPDKAWVPTVRDTF